MIFTPRPRISIKLRVSSYAYIHIFRRFNTLYAWIFYEFLGILPSTEGKGIIKSNEQNFFSYYAINHRSLKMSIISIIEVHTISPKELNMYLAEFIRSFRLKERKDYEPSRKHALLQVLRGIHQDMKIARNDSAVKLGCSEKKLDNKPNTSFKVCPYGM